MSRGRTPTSCPAQLDPVPDACLGHCDQRADGWIGSAVQSASSCCRCVPSSWRANSALAERILDALLRWRWPTSEFSHPGSLVEAAAFWRCGQAATEDAEQHTVKCVA